MTLRAGKASDDSKSAQDDVFILSTKRVLIVLVLLLIILPGVFTVALVFVLGSYTGLTPNWAVWGANLAALVTQAPKDFLILVSALISAIPATIAGVCYTNSPSRRLNLVGRISVLLVIFGAIAGCISLGFLDPSKGDCCTEIGITKLQTLQNLAEQTTRLSFLYLWLFLGMKELS